MKSDAEILFSRIRSIALKKPHRSKRFIKFVKDRSNTQGMDFHHVFGSTGPLKSTDLLGIAVRRDEHMMGELNKDWIIAQMPQAIENLIEYVKHLEGERNERI